jgi:hypothetical protein
VIRADGLFLARNGDGAAVRHGIAGIDHKVQQRQFELVRIHLCQRQTERKAGLDAHHGTDGPLQQIGHPFHKVRHIDRLGPEVLTAGKGQHALGQGGSALRP